MVEKPLGLGALSRSMLPNALDISSSVISLTSWLFSCSKTTIGILESMSRTSAFVSSLLGCWYRLLKWWKTSSLIWSKVSSCFPVFEVMEMIVFFFLRDCDYLWKKEVFESPTFTQRLLYFNGQCSSSLCKEWWRCCCSSFSWFNNISVTVSFSIWSCSFPSCSIFSFFSYWGGMNKVFTHSLSASLNALIFLSKI